jgi:glycerol-3-phosphate dehydrogenase
MKKFILAAALAPSLALATPANHPHFVTKAELDQRIAEVEQVTVNEYITEEYITNEYTSEYTEVYTQEQADTFAIFGAMASIPALAHGQEKGIGVGVSSYNGKEALAVGYEHYINNVSIKAQAGFTDDDSALGLGATIGF